MTESLKTIPVSKLSDADMQAAPAAMIRAARRAREIAFRTGTPIVIVRDGQLIERYVEAGELADPIARPAEKGLEP